MRERPYDKGRIFGDDMAMKILVCGVGAIGSLMTH